MKEQSSNQYPCFQTYELMLSEDYGSQKGHHCTKKMAEKLAEFKERKNNKKVA